MRLFHGTTIAVFGLLISSAPAFSGGGDGHRTVGMVADLLLRDAPTIRDTVKQILGGVSLSEASVFADCAKGPSVCQRPLSEDEKDYVDHNHQHHEFHYTDVAIQQSEYRLGAAGTRTNSARPAFDSRRFCAQSLEGIETSKVGRASWQWTTLRSFHRSSSRTARSRAASWNDIRSPVGAMSVNALLPLGRPAPRRFPPADMISVNLISIKNQFKLAAA
jgi:hypothetical protein